MPANQSLAAEQSAGVSQHCLEPPDSPRGSRRHNRPVTVDQDGQSLFTLYESPVRSRAGLSLFSIFDRRLSIAPPKKIDAAGACEAATRTPEAPAKRQSKVENPLARCLARQLARQPRANRAPTARQPLVSRPKPKSALHLGPPKSSFSLHSRCFPFQL